MSICVLNVAIDSIHRLYRSAAGSVSLFSLPRRSGLALTPSSFYSLPFTVISSELLFRRAAALAAKPVAADARLLSRLAG